MDKLRELLTQLSQADEPHETLEGIKPALSSLSRKEAEDGLKVIIEYTVNICRKEKQWNSNFRTLT